MRSRRTVPAASLALTLGLLAGGCADRTPGPALAMPVPSQWSSDVAGDAGAPAAQLDDWWRQFNDPVLDGLAARALRNNRDVREAVARVREARAGVRVAQSRWLPQLDADASADRARLSEHTRLPPPADNPSTLYQAGFDARWELDLFGSIGHAVAAARSDVAEADFAGAAIRNTVAAEVVRRYVELRASQSRLEVRQRQRALVDDSIQLTHSRYRAGLTSEADEWRARELGNTIDADIDLLEAEIRASAYRLALLCGEAPAALLAILGPAGPVPSWNTALPASVPADLLNRRPDLKQAGQAVLGADARRRAAAAQAYPGISLVGTLGLAALTTGALTGGGSLFWAVGPALSWPIFTGGRLQAKTEAAEAAMEQAQARYEKAVLGALADVEESATRLQRERSRSAHLADAIAADRTALHLAEERYARGLSDYLAVLDAQRQLYRLEDERIISERDAGVYLVALYKALGGGFAAAES